MLRLLMMIALLGWTLFSAHAQENDGPPIAILSPDAGSTFAYATIQSRALVWSKKDKVLSATITFTDARDSDGQANQDSHVFRFPGVTFDEGKKVFYATTAKGEQIPVARINKQLFLSTIEVLPNALIRVSHPHGELAVSLEAISPDDPAMKKGPPIDPDATHDVDLKQVLQ